MAVEGQAQRLARPSTGRIAAVAQVLRPIAAVTVIALVCVQVYLIAAFIFGAPGALTVHMTVGRIAVGFELLVLLTALVGLRHDGTELRLSAALVFVGQLQVSLASDLGSSPEVHAFHGLLALAVLALAWRVVVRARGRRLVPVAVR